MMSIGIDLFVRADANQIAGKEKNVVCALRFERVYTSGI